MATFSVIISEKGGAERRETFDQGEVNVGRVQGNEIMLPKGNVSKRHARLIFRDGRFIVTDLKSTNGTYVNGRKIAQATIVREGDKIYIGDFILRIEGAGSSSSSSVGPLPQAPLQAEPSKPPTIGMADESPSDLQSAPPGPPLDPAPPVGPPPLPPPPALVAAPPQPLDSDPRPADPPTPSFGRDRGPDAVPSSSRSGTGLRPPPRAPGSVGPQGMPVIEHKSAESYGDVISHFPLEQDPDESVPIAVPAAPRVPSNPLPSTPLAGVGTRPHGKTLPVPTGSARPALPPTAPGTPFTVPAPPWVPGASARAEPPRELVLPPPPGASGERTTAPSVGLSALGLSSPQTSSASEAPRSPAVPASGGVGTRRSAADDAARRTARRGALVALMVRVRELADVSGASPLSPLVPDEATVLRLERALTEAAATLSDRRDIDPDELLSAARRELFDLGALGRVFEGDDVTEIQVLRHDDVILLRDRRRVDADVGFSSEAAVATALRRLCETTGAPLDDAEGVVERRLPGGARLFALTPAMTADGTYVVVIRKPARADASLEEMVRAGVVSRVMASFLGQCVAARARILVTSALGGGGATLLGALSFASPSADRVVVLQPEDELAMDLPHAVTLPVGSTPEQASRAMRAAARLAPDRLIVGSLRGPAVAELATALGEGLEGVLALAHGPSLRHVVRRLASELACARPGHAAALVREELGASFDVAVEVARLPDGRLRVLRIAELDTDPHRGGSLVRDIFTFTIERTAAGGALEGTFASTGVVPRIADEAAARGIPFDAALFRRHGRALDPETLPGAAGGEPPKPRTSEDSQLSRRAALAGGGLAGSAEAARATPTPDTGKPRPPP